ncbi:MAG: tetratricopeptide repeat protein [Candidatus Sulfotelmatobacter sp.]
MRVHCFSPFRASLIAIALVCAPNLCAQQPAHSETAESHLGRGYDALKQDRYQVAVDEFRVALALDSSLVLRARFPLAVALFEEHKPAEARKEFETVRRETGEHPNVSYYLGRLDIDDRNYAGAIQNLNLAIAKPPFPDTSYYLGFAYFKQNDMPNAEKWLKQAAELNPRDSRIPYQLGFVYRKEGREEAAQESLALSADLHRQDDSEAQLRTECGQKLERGSRDDAHAVCDKLYHGDDADGLTALGMIYAQHGDLEAALKPFLRAAELSPQSPQVQYNLALTYFQMNRLEDARGPLEQSLKHWPDLFPLNALYGAVLVKLGREEQACDVLRHAHELNPQDKATADSLYFLSLKLAEKNSNAKQFLNALPYLNQAAKLRPQEAEPHKAMAEIYGHLGKSVQAEAEKKEAERLGGK